MRQAGRRQVADPAGNAAEYTVFGKSPMDEDPHHQPSSKVLSCVSIGMAKAARL